MLMTSELKYIASILSKRFICVHRLNFYQKGENQSGLILHIAYRIFKTLYQMDYNDKVENLNLKQF